MKLRELKLQDRNSFEQIFCLNNYELSSYNFSNIFIWKKSFRIFYTIFNEHLCLFFKDKNSCFMYLPPLPSKAVKYGNPKGIFTDHRLSVIKICFEIMDSFNRNRDISRIENVQDNDLAFFRQGNYTYFVKQGDYLYKREDIATLKGNRFKSKRSSYNYFVKHYDFKFSPFFKQDTGECLALYQGWARQRRNKFSDPIYQAMLDEGFRCQRLAMENFERLALFGYIVRIRERIAAYTFGFPINRKTFCILFEVCDLSFKGISKFIFSQLCWQLPQYEYVNVMDDSGLDNLRKEKLSYHPIRILPNYIIKKKYA